MLNLTPTLDELKDRFRHRCGRVVDSVVGGMWGPLEELNLREGIRAALSECDCGMGLPAVFWRGIGVKIIERFPDALSIKSDNIVVDVNFDQSRQRLDIDCRYVPEDMFTRWN